MLPIIYGYAFAFLTAAIVILGDTVIKLAAEGGHAFHHRYVVAGCGLYAISALMWFGAMRHVTLAQAGVAYSMITLLALAAIGALWFDEPVETREALGILAALVAMVLMIRLA